MFHQGDSPASDAQALAKRRDHATLGVVLHNGGNVHIDPINMTNKWFGKAIGGTSLCQFHANTQLQLGRESICDSLCGLWIKWKIPDSIFTDILYSIWKYYLEHMFAAIVSMASPACHGTRVRSPGTKS